MVYGTSKPARVKHSSYRSRPSASRKAMWCFLGTSPRWTRPSTLDPPRALLVALVRLEEGTEVPRAEARVSLALDDLVEERARRRVVIEAGRVLEEDLQEVAPRRGAVDEDLELAQLRHFLVDRAHADLLEPVREHVVVAARGGHELDPPGAHVAHRGEDVLHRERGVLDAVPPVGLVGNDDMCA